MNGRKVGLCSAILFLLCEKFSEEESRNLLAYSSVLFKIINLPIYQVVSSVVLPVF